MANQFMRYLVASGLWLWVEGNSVLNVISTEQPNPNEFQVMPDEPTRMFPVRDGVTIEGPKATNKFWTHWTEKAERVKQEDMAVWPMPYALKWGGAGEHYADEMHIMSRGPNYIYGEVWDRTPGGADPITDDKIGAVRCDFRCHISLGANETGWSHGHSVFHEDIFGIRMKANQDDSTKSVEYPVFSGMAYASALYSGGLTPVVKGCATTMTSITRVGTGRWEVQMERDGQWDNDVRNGEWRVYAINSDMTEVDANLDFNAAGEMNRPFDGWIRVARVTGPGDAAVLDQYHDGIVVACDLEVDDAGPDTSVVSYKWHLADDSKELLHYGWAHHRELLKDKLASMSRIEAPTKGEMSGVVGNPWRMEIDLSEAKSLSWMPDRPVPDQNKAHLLRQASSDFQRFRRNINLLFDLEHYFTGKFFQMCGQLCLILEALKGSGDPETLDCADVLEKGFELLHTRSEDGEKVDPEALAAGGYGPASLVYDNNWGGVVTRWGLYAECWNRDFGNACYNDHHYHFGYFVTSASVLVHLKPAALENPALQHYVDTLVRDTTNPSKEDTFFPLFRGYDWFDFHSWSHGVNSFAMGKDQESVSEDINLQYGLILWGRVTSRPWMTHLGATLLSCNFMAIKQYFLMRTGNPNHHEDFVKNHVTGVFFQNSIEYSTWFTRRVEWIHAIQMLPATPALLKIRDAEFCKQEWDDVLKLLPDDRIKNPYDDGPSSIVTTGSLAMFDAEQAWEVALGLTQLDNGMSRAWMLYWIAAQPTFPADGIAPPGQEPEPEGPINKASLLRSIDTIMPNTEEFVRFEPLPHRIFPVHGTDIAGPKATNKFWTHWTEAAEKGGSPEEEKPVYPMPFGLKFRARNGMKNAEMMISHAAPEYTYGDKFGGNVPDDRISVVSIPFTPGLALGADEDIGSEHNVFHEDLFGVKMTVTGPENKPDASVYYPVFSGMAYVSALYTGDLHPRITGADGTFNFKVFNRVLDGVWQIITQDDQEWRMYALKPDASKIVGGFPKFDGEGVMQDPFNGWLRVARIQSEAERLVFDNHALCVVDGGELQVGDNLSLSAHVGYKWHCHRDEPNNQLLHYGWTHHEHLLPEQQKAADLGKIEAPTKGKMTGFLGRQWDMYLDLTEAMSLSFLPPGRVPRTNVPEITAQVSADFKFYQEDLQRLFTYEFYRTGKWFQKLGMICLMLNDLKGAQDEETQACATLLETAFTCLHTRNVGDRDGADNQDLGVCGQGPKALIYDAEWGGIVHLDGYYEGCWAADYGNACYNNHHVHYGYFVVAASILVQLKPTALHNSKLQHFIDTLIRDTTNPSTDGLDTYFPPFRSFDWFDFHSWSRGVNASQLGKDQESVSEDINLQWGLILWGRVTKRPFIEKLGSVMLSCNFMAIEQYFFMRTGNPNYHPDFVKNHVTGIFFQSSINYTTWFNPQAECIHGIQMVPLSPALLKIRDANFAKQEWTDVLGKLPVSQQANVSWGWSAVITAGSLALFDATEAWSRMKQQQEMDDGMSRSWFMYWIATRSTFPADGIPPTEDEEPPADGVPRAFFWASLILGIVIVCALLVYLMGGAKDGNKSQELGNPIAVQEGGRSVNV